MACKQVKTTQIIFSRSKTRYSSKSLWLTHYTSVLPCMPSLHKNARKSWHGALTDEDMERLMECKRINNARLNQLYPLKTAGSGNRLLEAICMAIWGSVQDVLAVLKGDLRTALNDDDSYRTRWQNTRQKRHVSSSEGEWDDEWRKVLQCADSCDGLCEDIHVFVLAQVLRRPIIIVSVLSGDDDMAGIYLPLKQQTVDCVKTPIVLAYSTYFAPLVCKERSVDDSTLSGIPLIVPGSAQPVVLFLLPDEEAKAFALLQQYLDVTGVPTDEGAWLPVAKLYPVKFDPDDDLSDKFCKSLDEENMPSAFWEMVSSKVEMCSEPRSQTQPTELSNEIEEVDDCYYPRCKQPAPEPWWPYCYDHSPDSGLAPGGLLHSHKKLKEENETANDNVDRTKDTNQFEENHEGNCTYPGCEQPVPESWWPFCYKHSPDSGLAPGGLLHSHEKYMREQANTDEITVETKDSDEDICVYPNCNQPAPESWWPFCYEHSPDSGMAPGCLLHSLNQWNKDH